MFLCIPFHIVIFTSLVQYCSVVSLPVGPGHHQPPGQYLPCSFEGEVAFIKWAVRLAWLPGCQLVLGQQFSPAPAAPRWLSPHPGLKLCPRPGQGPAGQPWARILYPSPSHKTAKGENILEINWKNELFLHVSASVFCPHLCPLSHAMVRY